MQKPFTDIDSLISFLELDKKNEKRILKNSDFPFLLPYRLAVKIEKNNILDPIFRQFVPLLDEDKKDLKYKKDPLLEKNFRSGNFLKKYKNIALLLTSYSCAMNCRFCFRRFSEKTKKSSDFAKELELIKKDKELEEIILSGGDPLFLNNKILKDLLFKLDKIPHLKRLRLHTRHILAYPERIDDEFIKIFKNSKKQIVFVFHINHSNEIDTEVKEALSKLKNNNFLLFNQSVLLKGVNDSSKELKNLFETLISLNVIPYYLHQLDKVKGAKHFEVDIKKGKKIIKNLLENSSGYTLPRYVIDLPNRKSKTGV